MDPQRRAALADKRKRLREALVRREQLADLEPLESGLSAAGECFRILGREERRGWTPTWLPAGYSRIPWHIVVPAEETWFRDDRAARNRAFVEALANCARPEQDLLFVYEGRGASFMTRRCVAERQVDLFLGDHVSSMSPLWVTSPPGEWLIEVSGDHVRVAEAPADLPGTGEAAVDALLSELNAGGIAYVAFEPDDPGSPPLPDIVDCTIAPLRLATLHDDLARDAVLGFVSERQAPEGPVQLVLSGAKRVQLSRRDFERHFATVHARAADFNVSGPGAGWCVSVRRRQRTWVQAAG